ncbi:M14 family zinc carboxypeptidase [Egicoccus halophilus]|nr:M14 family zinc carboxypeptidase [Egicoccus halophilus]
MARKRVRRAVVGMLSTGILATLVVPTIAQNPSDEVVAGAREVEYPEIVEVSAPDRETLSELGSLGVDVGEEVFDLDDGSVMVHAILTSDQKTKLRGKGVTIGDTVVTEAEAVALQEEFAAMTAELTAAEAEAEESGDELRVQRAQWYEDPNQGRFLEVEVWTATGSVSASVTVNVAFDAGAGTEIGGPGTQSFNLSRFVDAGQYMFHRANSPVLITTAAAPTRMRVTTTLAGQVIGTREVAVTETLTGVDRTGPGAPVDASDTYQTSFIDKYLDATESTERIEALAAQFPRLAEIVEFPHPSNGYRRPAMALLDPAGPRVNVASGPAAGDYAYAAASYGPSVPASGVPAADAAFADARGTGEFPATDGCGPYSPGFPSGAIALVDRGNCNFSVKTIHAQNAGASAVVIVNNVAGAPTAPGGTAEPGTTVPTVMIAQADGATIRGALAASTGRVLPGAAVNNNARVGVESRAYGHEGGNDLTIRAVDPGAPNSPLTVTVSGDHIEIGLATNAAGTRNSTAVQVRDAINAHPQASQLVWAYRYRNQAGTGVVAPTPRIALSDYLAAPDSVSRDPFTIKALRIGRHRDGSRVGVFAYAQEHAREWATPLVAVETAERLLRNYTNDDNTRRLVDDLDIFIVPSINPDGTHYSMHDFTLQRRNLARYCGEGQNNDLLARNTWGVDLNRNFSVGSLFDGYAGASTSCTSDTFAGPSELSEPEARNEVWLTENHPNIKFSMNIHSHGGYFMWAPGAYKSAGRESLPRPSYGTERFFYEASSHILDRIKEHRGTAIWDSRVGPISDVLYSAAGNSGDEHFYNRGIFAWSFEVGASRRNAANTGWVTIGNGFTPPFEEGYEQAMEFSNGLIGMLEVARMYARDTVPPKSVLTPAGTSFDRPTRLTFSVDEPADVYYTLDGSRPTYDSPKLTYQGPRQTEASILVDRSTTVRWFSVDVRGNVEANYKPTGTGKNHREAKITIRP